MTLNTTYPRNVANYDASYTDTSQKVPSVSWVSNIKTKFESSSRRKSNQFLLSPRVEEKSSVPFSKKDTQTHDFHGYRCNTHSQIPHCSVKNASDLSNISRKENQSYLKNAREYSTQVGPSEDLMATPNRNSDPLRRDSTFPHRSIIDEPSNFEYSTNYRSFPFTQNSLNSTTCEGSNQIQRISANKIHFSTSKNQWEPPSGRLGIRLRINTPFLSIERDSFLQTPKHQRKKSNTPLITSPCKKKIESPRSPFQARSSIIPNNRPSCSIISPQVEENLWSRIDLPPPRGSAFSKAHEWREKCRHEVYRKNHSEAWRLHDQFSRNTCLANSRDIPELGKGNESTVSEAKSKNTTECQDCTKYIENLHENIYSKPRFSFSQLTAAKDSHCHQSLNSHPQSSRKFSNHQSIGLSTTSSTVPSPPSADDVPYLVDNAANSLVGSESLLLQRPLSSCNTVHPHLFGPFIWRVLNFAFSLMPLSSTPGCTPQWIFHNRITSVLKRILKRIKAPVLRLVINGKGYSGKSVMLIIIAKYFFYPLQEITRNCLMSCRFPSNTRKLFLPISIRSLFSLAHPSPISSPPSSLYVSSPRFELDRSQYLPPPAEVCCRLIMWVFVCVSTIGKELHDVDNGILEPDVIDVLRWCDVCKDEAQILLDDRFIFSSHLPIDFEGVGKNEKSSKIFNNQTLSHCSSKKISYDAAVGFSGREKDFRRKKERSNAERDKDWKSWIDLAKEFGFACRKKGKYCSSADDMFLNDLFQKLLPQAVKKYSKGFFNSVLLVLDDWTENVSSLKFFDILLNHSNLDFLMTNDGSIDKDLSAVTVSSTSMKSSSQVSVSKVKKSVAYLNTRNILSKHVLLGTYKFPEKFQFKNHLFPTLSISWTPGMIASIPTLAKWCLKREKELLFSEDQQSSKSVSSSTRIQTLTHDDYKSLKSFLLIP